MNGPAATGFLTPSRVHVGLDVQDLEESMQFYRLLFDAEPTKVRPGYAKFEPENPPVNLSLIEGSLAPAKRLVGATHYGVQVKSVEDVEKAAERLRAAGVPVRLEAESVCCYAVQTKAWLEDPDGNPWEIFVVLDSDAPARADEDSTCCASTCCSSS